MASVELQFLNTIVARELTNGMWFIASVFLLASLSRFLLPRLWRRPTVFALWNADIEVKLAWGISLIALGTAIRAGWIWAMLIAADIGAVDILWAVEQAAWLSYVAIGLGVWGAVCAVKAITEAATGRVSFWGYWLVVAAVSIGVPIAVNALMWAAGY